MHKLLKKIEWLVVERCGTMEGVVGFEGEVDQDGLRNEQVCFSKLASLHLNELPKLVSYCTKMGEAGTTEGNPTIHAQPLFNGKLPSAIAFLIYEWNDFFRFLQLLRSRISFQSSLKDLIVTSQLRACVAFPALEYLSIWEVPMIREIWPQQPLSKPEKEVESFCKLKSISVYCDQLEYVLPSYMLPQLHNLLELEVHHCKELEVIVSNKLKEKEATNNDILVFPQLKTLILEELDNLKCFCTGTDQLLFSHKVAFPALEYLRIWNTPSITGIWDKKPLSEPEQEIESFSKLETISIQICHQLVYVLPSYMLPRLQNLRNLEIKGCAEVEVIVSKELMMEKEAVDNDPIVFSQLKKVEFDDLPKLKSFYTGTQLIFSNKDAFPVLKYMNLGKDLQFLRNGTSTKEEINLIFVFYFFSLRQLFALEVLGVFKLLGRSTRVRWSSILHPSAKLLVPFHKSKKHLRVMLSLFGL
ncbi:hypothetical protein Vadar_016967 [Vaccinium darrowii]|uniref:Uncharacterized protein n=1 Tax=Vaccinium darrowii TaxID=229202 RepID=A0ACB7YM72_9ERIC|nr:hypothetical protein Vadar_016967 [Vaccinium darrowii]